MLRSHADLFKGHGMDPAADCHTLETKAMSAEECERHKKEIVGRHCSARAFCGQIQGLVGRYENLDDLGSHGDTNLQKPIPSFFGGKENNLGFFFFKKKKGLSILEVEAHTHKFLKKVLDSK